VTETGPVNGAVSDGPRVVLIEYESVIRGMAGFAELRLAANIASLGLRSEFGSWAVDSGLTVEAAYAMIAHFRCVQCRSNSSMVVGWRATSFFTQDVWILLEIVEMHKPGRESASFDVDIEGIFSVRLVVSPGLSRARFGAKFCDSVERALRSGIVG
jgi:hypothetical protein